MPQYNLRIIYTNIADTATIIPSSVGGSTDVNNLKNDYKTSLWRTGTHSNSSVKANLVVSFASSNVGGVVLPFTNLTSSASIRVRAYTGTAPTLGGTIDSPTVSTTGTLVYDTGVISACNYTNVSSYGTMPGISKYSYGGYRSARAWFPSNVTCTSLLIEILDTNTDLYVEASKLVVGEFWSPKFNTSFGAGVGFLDMSAATRLESGNQEVTRGPRYKTLNFDLKWLDDQDRQTMRQLLQRNGKSTPIFVSLFPQLPQVAAATGDELDLEATYTICGRLSEVQAIINSTFTFYSNTLQFEEI